MSPARYRVLYNTIAAGSGSAGVPTAWYRSCAGTTAASSSPTSRTGRSTAHSRRQLKVRSWRKVTKSGRPRNSAKIWKSAHSDLGAPLSCAAPRSAVRYSHYHGSLFLTPDRGAPPSGAAPRSWLSVLRHVRQSSSVFFPLFSFSGVDTLTPVPGIEARADRRFWGTQRGLLTRVLKRRPCKRLHGGFTRPSTVCGRLGPTRGRAMYGCRAPQRARLTVVAPHVSVCGCCQSKVGGFSVGGRVFT